MKKLTATELRCLQLTLLEMLHELDAICKKNNIQYSLFMGTLLGAERHQGFIPWDDDLDVAMTRPNYDAFAEACKRDIDNSRFFFQNHHTDPHYRWGYARIRRKDTVFVRQGQEHMKMQNGVFLDIFPIDSVPNFSPLRALHSGACFVLRKILYAGVGYKSGETPTIRLWYTALNLIPHSWALSLFDKIAAYRQDRGFARILSFPLPKGSHSGYPRHWFDAYDQVRFENASFPALQLRQAYLEFTYGNYMQLPPPEQRICCHPAAEIRLLPTCRSAAAPNIDG